MNLVRRALAAVAVGGTALGGIGLAGTMAAGTVAQAATRVPTAMSISAPHEISFGQSATVSGKLTTTTGHHKGLGGEQVLLRERRPNKTKWTVVTTTTTASDGTVSTSVSLSRDEEVQWVHPATATTARSTSTVRLIKVAYAVTASLSGTTVSVSVAPAAAKQNVLLQLQRHGRWSTVQTHKLGSASSTTFTIHPPKAKGTYNYRVVKPAAHGYHRGVSATLPLTVS